MVGELPGFPHHYLLERTVLDRTEQTGGQDTSLTNLLVSDNRYTSDYYQGRQDTYLTNLLVSDNRYTSDY